MRKLCLLPLLFFPLIALPQNADVNDDGLYDQMDLTDHPGLSDKAALFFAQFWKSPDGYAGNCWDAKIGYFDDDTLLDVAGYTFSPNRFYIYEQLAAIPDSFVQVFMHEKLEAGGFGPIATGDTDDDGLVEIIVADLSTLCRIYVFENTGDNTYVSQNTQSAVTGANNSQTSRFLKTGDMNKNGRKEIICGRGVVQGGTIMIWEQNGTPGTHVYSQIYSYTTPSYIFGQGGFGDSDNDGWDEVIISYGGTASAATNVRRIVYDSATAAFSHQMFTTAATGMPASWQVADLDNDGLNELLMTGNLNGHAGFCVFECNGPNSYALLNTIVELADDNNMLTSDVARYDGNDFPRLLAGSFNGNVYIYEFDGTNYVKQYENTSYGGSAIRRVYWTAVNSKMAFFNTWSSSSSNGYYYIFTSDVSTGIPFAKPVDAVLWQNYPNPFIQSTTLSFQLKAPADVMLGLFDVNGNRVFDLMNEFKPAGEYFIELDACRINPGVYYYVLNTGGFTYRKKLIKI